MIILPTEDLVSTMLEASPVPAEQVLGQLPPRNGTVTVEKVATSALMGLASQSPRSCALPCSGVLGAIVLQAVGRDIPDVLFASVAGLAGLLAPSPIGKR